jgi:tetratricopeptide (TPR) repeat protein
LTASVLASLGNFNAAQRKYPEAESFYKRALAIGEKVGPDTPATGVLLLQFADFYADRHLCREAQPLFQRSLRILEQSFGKKNVMVVNIRKDMEHCRSGRR